VEQGHSYSPKFPLPLIRKYSDEHVQHFLNF
jgi:hypothetical protein